MPTRLPPPHPSGHHTARPRSMRLCLYTSTLGPLSVSPTCTIPTPPGSSLSPSSALLYGPSTCPRTPASSLVASLRSTPRGLVLVPIPVDATVSEAVRETHAKLTKHINRLVGRRMSLA